MAKNANWLIIVVILLLFVVVGYRFEQYYLLKNFTLEVNTSCNPEIEKCFVMDCQEGDPGCDTSPYKKVEILARDAPKCLEEHSCDSFVCPVGLVNCSITYCSESALSDGERCVKPKVFIEQVKPEKTNLKNNGKA